MAKWTWSATPASLRAAASTRTRSSAAPTSVTRSTSASRPSWSTTRRRWRSSWFAAQARAAAAAHLVPEPRHDHRPVAQVRLRRGRGGRPHRVRDEPRPRVVGLSFHAGSQLPHPGKYVEAIDTCGRLVAEAAARGLPPLEDARHRRRLSDRLSRAGRADRDFLRADPRRARPPAGEAFVSSPSPAASSAGRRSSPSRPSWAAPKREGRWWYYLDDGIYGTFSGQLYDKMRFPLEPLAAPGPAARALRHFGPDLRQPRRGRRGPADAGARDRRAPRSRARSAPTPWLARPTSIFSRGRRSSPSTSSAGPAEVPCACVWRGGTPCAALLSVAAVLILPVRAAGVGRPPGFDQHAHRRSD